MYPTDHMTICHGRRPSAAPSIAASWLQPGIVGSGRPPLPCTGAQHWQGSSHRREHCNRSSFARLLARRVVGFSRSPGPAHCMPPRHTWVHSLPVRLGEVTCTTRPLPVALALLETLLWLPTAEGANDRRLVLPVTRKHSVRPSVS